MNPIIATNFINYGVTETDGRIDSSFPAINVQNYYGPHPILRAARSNTIDSNFELHFDMGANLLNPGFETVALANWTQDLVQAGSSFAAETGTVRTGSGSLKAISANVNPSYLGQQVAVQDNTYYRYGGAIDVTSYTSGTAFIAVAGYYPNGSTTIVANESISVSGLTGGWVFYDTGEFLVPKGIRSLRVSLIVSGTQTAYFDDIFIVPRVRAVATLGVNCTRVRWDQSVDNSSFARLTTVASEVVSQDLIDGYYKIFHQLNVSPESRYLRLRAPIPVIATSPMTDGMSYFQIGAVVFSDVLTTLSSDIAVPYNITAQRSYVGRDNDITPVGPFSARQEWELTFKNSTASEIFNLALLGEHQPILIYENRGNTSKVGLYRYTGGMQYKRGQTFYTANPVWIEIV